MKLNPERLKKPLIILAGTAVFLGIVSYVAVFYNPGYVAPTDADGADVATSSLAQIASSSSSSSSSLSLASSSIATGTAASSTTPTTSTAPGTLGSSFAAPYPLTWTEGADTFSIAAASLQGNALTFAIQEGQTGICAPTNLELVADEEGTLQPPSNQNPTPAADGTCAATFTLSAVNFPLLFTTGGTSNAFFEITTAPDAGLQVELPDDAG